MICKGILNNIMSLFDFTYTRSALNLKDALRMCEASRYVYESEKCIKEIIRKQWGFDRCSYIENYESQAFIAGNSQVLILALRGTEQSKLRDWITNLKFIITDHPWGKVHKGFSDALDLIWNQIEKSIKEFRDNKQPLWITGHSLGGALATLAASRCFIRRIGRLYGVYTFGQPRVGNKQFSDIFDSHYKIVTHRFVNNEDIVTCVPWISGYKHIGNLCYFDSMGVFRQDPDVIKRALDQFVSKIIRLAGKGNILDKIFPNEIEDHSLVYYEKLLKKNMI